MDSVGMYQAMDMEAWVWAWAWAWTLDIEAAGCAVL